MIPWEYITILIVAESSRLYRRELFAEKNMLFRTKKNLNIYKSKKEMPF